MRVASTWQAFGFGEKCVKIQRIAFERINGEERREHRLSEVTDPQPALEVGHELCSGVGTTEVQRRRRRSLRTTRRLSS